MPRWIVLFLLVCPMGAMAEAYRTTEIVKFVVSCMAENGGQTDENLYTCACRFDSISAKFTFEEYDSAVMFERYRDLSGKGGAMIRDSEVGSALKARLKKARAEATAECPKVLSVERPPSSRQE